NTAFTTVMERRWEHGLRRACGMSRRQLGNTLLYEATVAALLGWIGAVVVGITLGWLMINAATVNFATHLGLHVPVSTLLWCLGAALAASMGAALYPRWVALRVPIIDALRYE